MSAPSPTASSSRLYKAAQVLAIVAIMALGIWQFARAGFDWDAMLENANPWAFFIAMASLPVVGFPISVCYIYAGMAFEPLVGSIACIGALAINMSISFAITHTALQKPLQRWLANRDWKLPKLSETNQFRFVFLIRTIPGPPFFAQNLVLGLSGVPFVTYLWLSLATQGSIAVGMILGTRYLSSDPTSITAIAIMLALAMLLLIKLILKAKGKRSREEKA